MKMNKKIDFITLSPLLFLTLLPVGNWLDYYFTQTAVHPEIALHKYFSIPIVGFSFGFMVFLGMIRNRWELSSTWSFLIDKHYRSIVLTMSCLFFVCFSILAVLRYTTFHTSVYDMGTYDRRIWLISISPLSKIFYEAARGHFQPILVIHGFIYKIFDNPVVIQWLQTIAVLSGIIPIYLIAKEQLSKKILIVILIMIYLFYPPITFNAATEFHPDTMYIPLMLWAFYFAEKDKYIMAIVFAGIGGMSKEPLILGAVFFGLYLAIGKKQYKIGMITSLFFLSLFFLVIFKILPYINQSPAFSIETFPFFEHQNEKAGIFNIKSLIDSLLIWKVRKVLFIYFLLAPMLCLPLIEWKRFLTAIPLIGIPILSTTYLHSSVDSQYTAGIIAPAFVALVFSIKRIEDSIGEKYSAAFAIFVLLMTITFHISHSASPLSISFWKAGWAESWHKSNYVKGDEGEAIREAIFRIPEDPNKVVVSQGNINHARLAHRYDYRVFPEKWEQSDYILLSLKRTLLMGDRINEDLYQKYLERIRNNFMFKLEFQKDGVLLIKKINKKA